MVEQPMEKKLQVLKRLATSFQGEGITWALGASAMLCLRGRLKSFHDLDLFVTEEDVSRAVDILSSLGSLQPREASPLFASRHYTSYSIQGVQIDLIEGFKLLSQGNTFFFPLTKEKTFEKIQLEEVTIPLMDLESWEKYYHLMGRVEKAKLCRL